MAAASYFVLLFDGGCDSTTEDGDAEVQRLRQRQSRQTGVCSWIFFSFVAAAAVRPLLARVVVEGRQVGR